MSFLEKLTTTIARNSSTLCVGLDPTFDTLPDHVERSPAGVLAFNKAIIDATAGLVCAYKPNLAFYEAMGAAGWHVLADTIRHVPAGIPVIGDAKRGDIATTSAAYADALFDDLGFDACTVSPYMGLDSLAPFVDQPGRFIFVLCRTSNPGAALFQDLLIDGAPLYQHVARQIQSWEKSASCGLVIGATDPNGARRAVTAAPHLWLLAPGLGAQGGDLHASVQALGASASRTLWNVSRSVAGAGRGRDFADRASDAAQRLRDDINTAVGGHG